MKRFLSAGAAAFALAASMTAAPAGAGEGSPPAGPPTGTQEAVDLALSWIAAHQEADGRFSSGRHGGADKDSHDVGVTALAVLALLGNGNTEEAGDHAAAVKKALDWLEKRQDEKGAFSDNNYAQGMATLAMVDAAAMTGNRQGPAQKAVDCVAARQQKGGGWDYGDQKREAERNDTSITSWQVMALKTAEVSGLEAAPEALEGAKKHLKSAGADPAAAGGEVFYAIEGDRKEKGTSAITAMAICDLLTLGSSPTDPFIAAGAKALLEEKPSEEKMNLYRTYFASQALFVVGGETWKKWDERTRPSLLAHQAKEGEAKGSWDPQKDAYGLDGGRVYSTAFAVLSLQIYERPMPPTPSP